MTLDRLDADPDAYRLISETLAGTGVYGIGDGAGAAKPTAFRPPLYPYFLSWMVKDGQLSGSAVALLHATLGVLTVVLTFVTAQKIFFGSRKNALAGVAALLVAIDPILLQQSTLVMTETFATMIASVIVWWWVARCTESSSTSSVIALGILMALAYLCRPTFLVWSGLMAIVLLFTSAKSWSGRFARTGAFATLIAAAVLGWTIRNHRTLGHPVWATTHGGYTLLLANNPSFYEYLRSGKFGTPWNADEFVVAYTHRYDGNPNTEEFWKRDWKNPADTIPIESEVADDRRCYEAARSTINREPGMFAWSCLVRLARLWSPFPHRAAERSSASVYGVGIYYLLFMVALVAGLWRLHRQSKLALWWPAITIVIALSGVHAIYWSNLRMRAPSIPVLAIVAAAAFLPRQEQSAGRNASG